MGKVKVDRQKLKKLYYSDKLTHRQIARYFGCAMGTIHNRLKEYGFRSRARQWDRQELEELYWKQGLDLARIGKLKGVSLQSVLRIMVKLGIPRRNTLEENSPRWKGGRIRTENGYIRIKNRTHPRADHQGYVLEHLLIWEEANGMPVPKGFEVHHKNGVKDDNRPSNLVALSKGKHRPDLFLKEIQKRLRQVEAQLAQQRMQLG